MFTWSVLYHMSNLLIRRSFPRDLLTSILHSPSLNLKAFGTTFSHPQSLAGQLGHWNSSWGSRSFSSGLVNLVVSQGRAKFETHEAEPPSKHKWKTKKKLKMQRKRDKQKRKSENKRDPRYIGIKGKKKNKFETAEERIKYKIEKAKIKEALLIERLKKYEVRRQQGPVVEPEDLTGEEKFYMKKMAQKSSNYLTVGRRGVFGGVVLNMHLHWKKHETVKVICKPCKPGQVHQYAEEIARLSGGIPIQMIGNDTIIFYRGKNYVQPEVMSPIDTLSKKKALEKSKYEQSLESVRRFIAIAEKELELYYRHVALYGDPNDRSSYSAYTSSLKSFTKPQNLDASYKSYNPTTKSSSEDLSDIEYTYTDQQKQLPGRGSDDACLSDTDCDANYESLSDCDANYESLSDCDATSEDEEGISTFPESSVSFTVSSSTMGSRSHFNN